MNIIPNGVLEDLREEEAKGKDYTHPIGSVPINWVEKTEWKKYTQRFQDGSSSCVWQSFAKAIETICGKVISATPYMWRKNYPEAGGSLSDAADIFYNRFSCTESASPSQNQSEADMNNIKALTTNIGISGYRRITQNTDIDLVAEAIEGYKHCVLSFNSNGDEWAKTPFYTGATLFDENGKFVKGAFGHCICGVDYGLVDGVKTIRCEDSSGQWSSPDGSRFITQDFLEKRGTGAYYGLGVKDVTVPQDKVTQQKITILKALIDLYKQLLAKFLTNNTNESNLN